MLGVNLPSNVPYPQLRRYSTEHILLSRDANRAKASSSLDPYFVPGFMDAEGSFLAYIRKASDTKTGLNVNISFQINLNNKDRVLLELIQDYFGGIGAIYYNDKRDSANFMVSSLEKLLYVIIPHFDKYPLITQKLADYVL